MVYNRDEIVSISIFDMMGKPIGTIEHSAVKSSIGIGSSMRSDMCVVQVYGAN